jgi:hypothetical protein
MPLLPLRGLSVSGMYVCNYIFIKQLIIFFQTLLTLSFGLQVTSEKVCTWSNSKSLMQCLEELDGPAVSALGVRSWKLSNVLKGT